MIVWFKRCREFAVYLILFVVAMSCSCTLSADRYPEIEPSSEIPGATSPGTHTSIASHTPITTVLPIPLPTWAGEFSETGQWLLVPMKDGIWSLQEGQDSLEKFSDIREGFGLSVLEPGGPIVVKKATTSTSNPSASGLHLLDFPSGKSVHYRNVVIRKPFVWSRDGSMLAVFQRMRDSYTLLSLSVDEGEMIPILDGLYDVGTVLWSSDDNWILVGGRGISAKAGISDFTYWKVNIRESGAEIIYQQDVLGMAPYGGATLGWVSNTDFISDVYRYRCRFSDLKRIDGFFGEITSIWPDNYSDRAIDPESGFLLVSISDEKDINHPLNHEPGLYLVSALDGEVLKISDQFSNCRYWRSMEWSPEANQFFVYSGTEILAINLKGEITHHETPHPPSLTVSPTGDRWIITSQHDDPGLWIGSQNDALLQITSDLPVDPIWGLDGESFYYFVERGRHQVDLFRARSPDFKPELIASDLPYIYYRADPIWVSTGS